MSSKRIWGIEWVSMIDGLVFDNNLCEFAVLLLENEILNQLYS